MGGLNLIDLTGKEFGRLTVTERAENSRSGHTRWVCLCECGTECTIQGQNLRNGRSQSCGCYRSEVTAEKNRRPAFGKEIKA